MSMTVSVDPRDMTPEQRQAVASFILGYPSDNLSVTVQADAKQLVAEMHEEIAALEREHTSTMPVAAFGTPVAGVPPTLEEAFYGRAAAFVATPPPPPLPPAIAPPPPPATGVALDSKGFPWDGRIHSESKAKVSDGTWRMRRNLDPAVKATVEAELRQTMSAPAPAATPAPWPFPAPAETVAPPPPPPAIVPPEPKTALGWMANTSTTMTEAEARQAYVALIGRASASIQTQKVTTAEVTQCCADAGVPALQLLANRLDLVGQVAAHIDALIAARG